MRRLRRFGAKSAESVGVSRAWLHCWSGVIPWLPRWFDQREWRRFEGPTPVSILLLSASRRRLELHADPLPQADAPPGEQSPAGNGPTKTLKNYSIRLYPETMEPFRQVETKSKIISATGGELGNQLMREQPESVWCLDYLMIEDGKITVDGWALTPPGAKPALTVNGVKLPVQFGRPRSDLERVMSFDLRAPTAGFRSEGFDAREVLAHCDTLEIQFCDDATRRPFNPGHCFYWPIHAADRAFPDPVRRKRVHGDTNLEGFILNGYSTFKKLSISLAKVSRTWNDFSRILDWGCGCGRVLRYLPSVVLPRLVGADIDHDNIAWCKRTFPEAEFHAIPLLPPTDLPSDAFDLVVGVSVFTHLRDQPQHAWLKELSRVARKGALLLVTIHGPAAATRANISEEQYQEWMTRGFVDTGLNIDLRGAIPDDSYYVNTLHTHAYVRHEWGKYFEIIDIHPASIANHQDLVVMRRR